jgi:hypothetical protein
MLNPNTRIIDLTVGELVDLIRETTAAVASSTMPEQKPRNLEYGIAGIARIFNCSMATANRIKASGKIDDAITQTGRIIVIDVDRALQLKKTF